jgi:hypothetical protein
MPSFPIERKSDGVVIVRMKQADNKANVLSKSFIADFHSTLDALEKDFPCTVHSVFMFHQSTIALINFIQVSPASRSRRGRAYWQRRLFQRRPRSQVHSGVSKGRAQIDATSWPRKSARAWWRHVV